MESGHRLFFDPTCHGGNMMVLGNGDSLFRGPRSLAMNMEETLKKRPFFSSPDELFDDEYYDDQSSEKKRRLTVEQVHMLEKSFETENKLEPERKSQLAKNLGLQPRQVAVWFQNRRARWKTKQLERDFDLLKSSYESLLSDYEASRKEADKLKDEVVSLTKKLQPKEHVLVPLEQTPNSLPTDLSRPSSDSTGVVDEVDGPQQQLVDSGDSYFPNHGGDMGLSGEDDGSIGVVDEVDGPMHQFVDNENSYFRNHDGTYPVGDTGLSGEDDCSDDGGRIYFSEAYVAALEQHHEDEEEGYSFGWWVWS